MGNHILEVDPMNITTILFPNPLIVQSFAFCLFIRSYIRYKSGFTYHHTLVVTGDLIQLLYEIKN